MDNFKTLKYDGSEGYSDCTHTVDNSEVVFSIQLSDDGFYEAIVRADGLQMACAFSTMSRAQMWANYIYIEMQLDGVSKAFEKYPYAVKAYKGEVA